MGQIQQTEQTIVQPSHDPVKDTTGATMFEWFQAWMPLLLVAVPIWWAWKQAKMKQSKMNAERLERYREEGREHEYSDKTKLNMIFDEITRRKNE